MLYEVISRAPGTFRLLDIFDWPNLAEAYASEKRDQGLNEVIEIRARQVVDKADRHEPTRGTPMRSNIEASVVRQLRDGELDLAASLARVGGLDLKKIAEANKLRLPKNFLATKEGIR